MPENTPNIGPVSDEKAEALFDLWCMLEEIFSPAAFVTQQMVEDDDG